MILTKLLTTILIGNTVTAENTKGTGISVSVTKPTKLRRNPYTYSNYIMLYCIHLYYTILYYIILYYNILYYFFHILYVLHEDDFCIKLVQGCDTLIWMLTSYRPGSHSPC